MWLYPEAASQLEKNPHDQIRAQLGPPAAAAAQHRGSSSSRSPAARCHPPSRPGLSPRLYLDLSNPLTTGWEALPYCFPNKRQRRFGCSTTAPWSQIQFQAARDYCTGLRSAWRPRLQLVSSCRRFPRTRPHNTDTGVCSTDYFVTCLSYQCHISAHFISSVLLYIIFCRCEGLL